MRRKSFKFGVAVFLVFLIGACAWPPTAIAANKKAGADRRGAPAGVAAAGFGSGPGVGRFFR